MRQPLPGLLRRTFRPRRWLVPLVVVVAATAMVWHYLPRLSALAFIVRVAKQEGAAARLAELAASKVRRGPVIDAITRHGPVPARLYSPVGRARRTTLLVPGVHMDGIEEERLVGLATELAGAGLQVLTVAPLDLTRYRVTTATVDELEDVVAWAASQPGLAPDGKVGITAFSFSGALALVAAGRPAIHDRIAFAFSFGGYADLPRVLRYLCGDSRDPLPSPDEMSDLVTGGEHIHVPKPHDYGSVVAILNLADRLVPAAQVPGLREAITEFLRASSIDRLAPSRAQVVFAEARALGQAMPEPSRTLMGYVNERRVDKLGEALLPILPILELPAELSPARSPAPSAPVFLLHGADDSVVPASEMVWLTKYLQGKTQVRTFASRLITHAEVNRKAALSEIWQLSDFWRDLMSR
jgi:dienelactone hydrolase